MNASPSQPATFYFHKQSSKTIDNATTTLWANTTQIWSASAQSEPRSGIKSGIPAIWDFYTEPVMPGNVTLNGPLTFTVYLQSSATTGAGTVTTGAVTEVTSTGMAIPLATASATGAIGTGIVAYSFSINSNTYMLSSGGIIHFTVTVSIPNGSSRTLTLYYDTATYHSSVSLSFQNRLGITSFAGYNQTGIQISSYSRNWTLPGRVVNLRAVIFDALGTYDIGSAATMITSPSGSTYASNTPLTHTSGSLGNYSGTWVLSVNYSVNDASGAYTSNLTVLDNSGNSLAGQLVFNLFAFWGLNLQTVSSDTVPVPVSGVSVTILAGSTPIYTGASDSTGTVNPSGIILRDDTSYSISSFWEGLLVNQTGPYSPRAPSTIPLRIEASSVDFSQVFRNGDNAPLSQPITSLLVAAPNGTVIDPNPSQAYLLPWGTYLVNSAIIRGTNVVTSPSPSFNPKISPFTIDLQTYQLTLVSTDQNNQPLANAKVTIQLSGVTIYQGTTAADGSLVIQDVPKGQYLVTVSSGSQSSTTTVSVSQDTTGRIQLAPPPPAVPAASPDWVGQTLGWIVLAGAVVGGLVGYTQYSKHSKLAVKDEPFDSYLNTVIPGGIQDGETTLIVGADGSGKTTVCEQLAYKSLLEGHPTVFLTYESSQAVKESMKSFHWDTSIYEAQKFFQLIDCEVQAPGQTMGVVENFYDVAALNLNIASALDNAATKPRLFIDSLTDLALKANPTSVTGMVTETKDRVKKLQGEFFMTIERSVPRSMIAKLADASDNMVELEHREENGRGFTEFMVRKCHGQRFEAGTPLRLRAVPGKGLVFEVRKGELKAPAQPSPLPAPTNVAGKTVEAGSSAESKGVFFGKNKEME